MNKKFLDLEIDGINTNDYPDFVDAFICNANVEENGVIRQATEEELEELNDNRDLVYNLVIDHLY